MKGRGREGGVWGERRRDEREREIVGGRERQKRKGEMDSDINRDGRARRGREMWDEVWDG